MCVLIFFNLVIAIVEGRILSRRDSVCKGFGEEDIVFLVRVRRVFVVLW